MGSGCKKCNQNRYFEARKNAALCNPKLYSREGASEMLGLSTSTLADYELGNIKVIPVDKVVLMADLYNAPELKTTYCMTECPIHGFLPLATKQETMQGIALHILNELDINEVELMKKDLINIMQDGSVNEEESERLKMIMARLESLAKVISEMKISCEKYFE